jgi:hypothetical protein
MRPRPATAIEILTSCLEGAILKFGGILGRPNSLDRVSDFEVSEVRNHSQLYLSRRVWELLGPSGYGKSYCSISFGSLTFRLKSEREKHLK